MTVNILKNRTKLVVSSEGMLSSNIAQNLKKKQSSMNTNNVTLPVTELFTLTNLVNAIYNETA